ncbi:Arginase family hydrolase, arginase/agmainase/formiminoglutamate hydrolase [Kibdelosporangium sp. 4NS15]|uniref:Arginase family hydrolase, arginase/agmainase/formiminoglutamate hydrolase n=1 Tax=Kibdelosporangium persicum TaxID=2698649 RepID=A0ABX2FEF3_9PSEU|nr:arginase family protein [Kibdelosporangium persicum]NRN69260.1 Arginase family hydrolase, arginase/agmainase/formiminoglutamate hydrolase [Kibdelosporangium persicum]
MQIHAVPQRQGALVDKARFLPDGCLALSRLAGEIAGVEPSVVPVSTEDSPAVGGVANRAALIVNRTAQLAALEAPGGPVLTIGGDCGSDVAPIGVARFRHGENLGVVWFDAHPDLNTPSTSPSGAFHGMALRVLFGEGDPEFVAGPALRPGNAVLVGARSIDPGEQAAIDRGLVTSDSYPGERIYLHVDLDVLDPSEFGGATFPEPDGLSIAEVAATIDGIPVPVVGAGITECATADPAQIAKLRPLVEAVVGALRRGAQD